MLLQVLHAHTVNASEPAYPLQNYVLCRLTRPKSTDRGWISNSKYVERIQHFTKKVTHFSFLLQTKILFVISYHFTLHNTYHRARRSPQFSTATDKILKVLKFIWRIKVLIYLHTHTHINIYMYMFIYLLLAYCHYSGSTQPREVNWGATWMKKVAAPGLENRD